MIMVCCSQNSPLPTGTMEKFIYFMLKVHNSNNIVHCTASTKNVFDVINVRLSGMLILKFRNKHHPNIRECNLNENNIPMHFPVYLLLAMCLYNCDCIVRIAYSERLSKRKLQILNQTLHTPHATG